MDYCNDLEEVPGEKEIHKYYLSSLFCTPSFKKHGLSFYKRLEGWHQRRKGTKSLLQPLTWKSNREVSKKKMPLGFMWESHAIPPPSWLKNQVPIHSGLFDTDPL